MNKSKLIGSEITLNGKIIVTDYISLILGKNVNIGENTYFESNGGITIGDYSTIGKHCKFYTIENNPNSGLSYLPIYIGKNVTISQGVTILPGTIIEDNSFIPIGKIINGRVNFTSSQLDTRDKAIEPIIEEKKLFFVVSTGRSGSATIAKFLSQHNQVECLHEPRNQLIRLSTEYEYGNLTFDQVVEELDYLYNKASVIQSSIYGESHQKLTNLILPLSKLFPNAKFVWLIREGKKVVKSTTEREWYVTDKSFVHKYRGKNNEGWEEYRLQGDLCGSISEAKWKKMDSFEKNCWYWYYWNNKIKTSFEQLPNHQKIMLKLEELEKCSSELQQFLNVDKISKLNSVHTNKAKKVHKKKSSFLWEKKHSIIFNEYCGNLNKTIYQINTKE